MKAIDVTEPSLPTSILFVDGTNLDHRAKEAFARDDFDFPKLFTALTVGTDLIKVNYFTSPYIRTDNAAKYSKQLSDFNVLRSMPLVNLVLGRHQPRKIACRQCHHTHDTFVEKGTDIAAGASLVHAACHKLADRLILFTGDNDFYPAVRLAHEEGAHVEVAFVIKPHEPIRDQLNCVGMLRCWATRYVKMDTAFMANCWRNP